MIFKARPKQNNFVEVFYVADDSLTPINELEELQLFLKGKFVVSVAPHPYYKYIVSWNGDTPIRMIGGGFFLWLDGEELRVADRETVHNFLEIDPPLVSMRG